MSLIEVNESSDGTNAKVSKNKDLPETSLGHGWVTVIKNQGKPDEQVVVKDQHNLLTTLGITYFHRLCYAADTATSDGATDFIALSSNADAVAVGDSDLTAEIGVGAVTADGLQRQIATTHDNTANVTSLVKTFIASGTHTAVIKSALFNAAAGASTAMSHIAKWSTGAVTLVSGDTLAVTWTLTLG